jgi:hypothetical protein
MADSTDRGELVGRWSFRWSTWREFKDDVRPTREALATGAAWPMPAQGIMRVFSTEWPKYAVDVELRLDAFDEPVVTGVVVRRSVPMKAKGKRASFDPGAEWPEDVEPLPLSLRDVRRLPLDRIATAALVAVRQFSESPSPDRMLPVAEALRLPGRPVGRNKERFYTTVAKLYRMYALQNRSPAKEIAKRKQVSENTAHQWIYKARQLGYLEPSQRSGRRKEKKR